MEPLTVQQLIEELLKYPKDSLVRMAFDDGLYVHHGDAIQVLRYDDGAIVIDGHR